MNFNDFIKDLTQVSNALDTIAGAMVQSVIPPKPSTEELDIINIDYMGLESSLETILFGLRKDPMRIIDGTTFELHEKMKAGSIPKHHVLLYPGNRVHISNTLDKNFNPEYYMNDALYVRDRSTRQRFDCNRVVFSAGEMISIEYSPGDSSLEIMVDNGQLKGFEHRTFYYDLPRVESDIESTVIDGISTDILRMYWNFENKKYGRSKMPKFFYCTKQIPLQVLLDIYE